MVRAVSAGGVLDLFGEFTRLYRPSGEEEAVRQSIEALVARARDRWPSGSISTARDSAGNLLVRLPGTGRFVGQTKPIVLQAHMDMVLAVEGAKPGEDLRPYFRDGVQTELVTIDGQEWIRARGAKTTLGADNAVGMAVAARYIVDPSLAHPPLELVFTSREEVGLIGARQMSLPLAGRVLLNFDTPGSRTLTRGSMGSAGALMAGAAATGAVDAGAKQLQLEISGLRGGHAGRDAHRGRLNAILAGAEIIAAAARFGGRLVSARSGDGIVFNKINDACSITLVLPEQRVDEAVRDMRAKLAELVAKSDEDPRQAKLTASIGDPQAAKAFTLEATQRFGAGLAAVPNGLLVADPSYPDTVKVSSNVGYLKADAGDGSLGAVYTARAFTADDTKTWQARIEAAVSASFPVARVQRDAVASWLIAQEHWLVRTALALGKGHIASTVLLPATIECGPICALYAGMAAVSLGIDMVDNHTTRERVRRDGIPELAVTAQALVESVGDQMMREL